MDRLNDDLNIYSEQVNDVLSTPPKALYRWGNTIVLFFILIILLLSWLIKYPDIVSAQATLTTEIPPQKEFAKISGKIDSLFVENYQDVHKAEPIALIENTANYKDIIYLKSILDTLNINRTSFYFPLDDLPMLSLGEIETQFSRFENNYILYYLNKRSESFLKNNLTTNYSLSELKYRLRTSTKQRELSKEELQLKKNEIERNKALFNKEIISAQEYEHKQLEYLLAERDYNNMSLSISQLKEAMSNTNNLKHQTSIDNIRTEINLLNGVMQSLDQLKTAIKDWESSYLFSSNINGKVSFMKIWSENQTIHNGDFVFTIVPKNHSSYICKVLAPVMNSGKIRIGQDVNIKLSSYPVNEFGVLKGKVKDISLVPNNEGLYLIDVSLPKKLTTTHSIEIEFKQEMQGIAEIVTENLRLSERIFYQFKEIFE